DRPVDGSSSRGLGPGPGPRLAVGRIDRHDDRLRAEQVRELGDKGWSRQRGSVDRDLVRTGAQKRGAVGDAAHTAADGERNRQPFGNSGDERKQRRSSFQRRLHVEEDELIGTRVGVGRAELYRIAYVAEVL